MAYLIHLQRGLARVELLIHLCLDTAAEFRIAKLRVSAD
jgi:hypothetical protein